MPKIKAVNEVLFYEPQKTFYKECKRTGGRILVGHSVPTRYTKQILQQLEKDNKPNAWGI